MGLNLLLLMGDGLGDGRDGLRGQPFGLLSKTKPIVGEFLEGSLTFLSMARDA